MCFTRLLLSHSCLAAVLKFFQRVIVKILFRGPLLHGGHHTCWWLVMLHPSAVHRLESLLFLWQPLSSVQRGICIGVDAVHVFYILASLGGTHKVSENPANVTALPLFVVTMLRSHYSFCNTAIVMRCTGRIYFPRRGRVSQMR